MSKKLSLGFLGAGKMATALAKGFIQAGLVSARQTLAADPSKTSRAAFTREVGAPTTPSNRVVAEFAQVLVLAVKPDQVAAVLDDIRDRFTSRHLLISIAAGIPLARLEAVLAARFPARTFLPACLPFAQATTRHAHAIPPKVDLALRIHSQ